MNEISIDIEKINELCGSEVFKAEDFEKSRFNWFNPQDRHDLELRKYETKFVSKKIEIALLEMYKAAASSDTECGNAYFGVEWTDVEDFDLLNLHRNDKNYINIPLEEECRSSGYPVRQKRYNRLELRESIWNDAAIAFRAGVRVFENLGYKKESLVMRIDSPFDSFRATANTYYYDLQTSFKKQAWALSKLFEVEQLAVAVNNRVKDFACIKGSLCLPADEKKLEEKLSQYILQTEDYKDNLPFDVHNNKGEINYELHKLHSVIVKELRQEKGAVISKIDSSIAQLKSEIPLAYDDFKQKTLAAREAEKAKKAAQEARELAERRAEEKKIYNKLMAKLKSSGLGLGETNRRGIEKPSYPNEASAQAQAVERTKLSDTYITVYSKEYPLENGTGTTEYITRWYITSQDAVEAA